MRLSANNWAAITLAKGQASGPVCVLQEPLSFWGGLDAATGKIIDRWHPQAGTCLTGTILLMTSGRGSSSGSSVLAEAIRRGTGPAGIVLASRDAIITVGAMVANELYQTACPVVLADARDWEILVAAPGLHISARHEGTQIRLVNACVDRIATASETG